MFSATVPSVHVIQEAIATDDVEEERVIQVQDRAVNEYKALVRKPSLSQTLRPSIKSRDYTTVQWGSHVFVSTVHPNPYKMSYPIATISIRERGVDSGSDLLSVFSHVWGSRLSVTLQVLIPAYAPRRRYPEARNPVLL